MTTALIIYGTTTGNTEDMADRVKQALTDQGVETQVKDVTDAEVQDLGPGRDLLLLGCPAYGHDSAELQEDFEAFFGQMNGIDLAGRKFAVFAPGDSSYEYFCGSVDVLEEKMTQLGGDKAAEGLKIDGDPGDYRDEIADWCMSVAKSASA